MKYSKAWLQNYIIETLPENKIIEEELNAKAFEVEGIEKSEDNLDSIFDIKVLPNRAHDALGHIGMARELCACLGLTFNNKLDTEIQEIKNNILEKNENKERVSVEIIDKKACSRFMAIKIDGVKVGASPEFIKQALQNIGQKSINNIVDITNYVQYTLNKPMHAYDANNIIGGIKIRYASEGEKLVTLDDKELELNTSTLVIADHSKALGLAGIKGGKFSGVSPNTTSIIIESANFEPVLIRKTSQKYNLKTDASKRFENGISDILVEDALYYTIKLILENCTENNEVKISEVTDIKSDNYSEVNYTIGVTKDEINSVLGSKYSELDIENSLNKLGFAFEKMNTLDYIKNNIEKVMGAEYKNPASNRIDAPKYFSCSSIISYLFKGVWMPSLSIDKYVFCNKVSVGEKVDESILKYGDLIFANTGEGKIRYETVEYMRGTKVEDGVDHLGTYIGEGKVLHATKVTGGVIVESIQDFSKNRKIVGVGRVEENLEKERYVVTVPHTRLDLKIKENIIEEVGRIIGYKTLIPVLPRLEAKKNYLNKKLNYQNIIRNILLENNFSEVMNYSFVEKGEITLLKAAINKNKLRTNIADGILESVNKNLSNMPLLNLDIIKTFEFGNVFTKEGEYNNLCISIDDGKKKSNYTENIDMILSEIKKAMNLDKLEYEVKSPKPYILEINFDKVLESLSDDFADMFVDEKYINRNAKFESYSIMPFIVRDVAFWIDEHNELLKENNILDIIKEEAGNLCIKVTKFDEFKKEIDGVQKISLGFRLLYQSFEKTLTDEEVNMQSDNVYKKLKELGLEVR